MESDQSNVALSIIVQSGSDVHLTGIAMLNYGDAIVCGTAQPVNNMPPIYSPLDFYNFAEAAVWINNSLRKSVLKLLAVRPINGVDHPTCVAIS